jgi:hypothetical protein
VVKLVKAPIDDLRHRMQQQTTGHRGHEHGPLYESASRCWPLPLRDRARSSSRSS